MFLLKGFVSFSFQSLQEVINEQRSLVLSFLGGSATGFLRVKMDATWHAQPQYHVCKQLFLEGETKLLVGVLE